MDPNDPQIDLIWTDPKNESEKFEKFEKFFNILNTKFISFGIWKLNIFV